MGLIFDTREVDHGYNGILAGIQAFSKAHVLVGWPGEGSRLKQAAKRAAGKNGKTPPTGTPTTPLTVAEVAFIMEYGSMKNGLVPRPIMAQTIARTERTMLDYQAQSFHAVLDGKATVQQALAKLGVWFEGELKRSFTVETFAPLQPRTIAAKKSSRPLIDSGQLRQSVTSRVVL